MVQINLLSKIGNISYDAIEGAKNCLENSRRLFVDSNKVSKPTKYALIAISVEEVAKGYMLLLGSDAALQSKVNIENVISSLTNDLKQIAGSEELRNGLTTYNNILKNMIKPVEPEWLEDHQKKLGYIKQIINLNNLFVSIVQGYIPLQSNDNISQIIKKHLPIDSTEINSLLKKELHADDETDLDIKDIIPEFNDFKDFIDSILSSAHQLDLGTIKEKGFYVDKDNQTGKFVSPVNNNFSYEISYLKKLTQFLFTGLEWQIFITESEANKIKRLST